MDNTPGTVHSHTAAVILAAGYSSRMGRFKPLLTISGIPLIEHTFNAFASADITDIVVVTGNNGDLLKESMEHLRAVWIENPDFHEGMYTSVRAGVRALPVCDSFFVIPADIPFVRPFTLNMIIGARSHRDDVLIPTYTGIDGHPPLISSTFIPGILQYDGTGGLREFFRQNCSIRRIPTGDEGILLDCDDSEDLKTMDRLFSEKVAPTEAECLELLTEVYRVDEKILLHSKKVASLAVHLACAAGMEEKQKRLLYSSALLHDIVRNQPEHDMAGSAVLMSLGFPEAARIIADHMNIRLDAGSDDPDASQVLYLADKCVRESEVIDLENRFREKILKMDDNAEAAAAIQQRLYSARLIIDRIELRSGMSFSSILGSFKG